MWVLLQIAINNSTNQKIRLSMPILRGTAKDFEPLLAKKRENSVPNVAENTERHKSRAPRSRKPKEFLPENQVEDLCVSFLRASGWTVTRQQSALVRGPKSTFRVGKPGTLDWRCEKPAHSCATPRPETLSFQMELKAPGKKPSTVQIAEINDLTARGFVAVWFDGFSNFERWFQETFGRRSR